MADLQILMGEQITEVNDLSRFGDRSEQVRIALRDHPEGLADDDELTFNR